MVSILNLRKLTLRTVFTSPEIAISPLFKEAVLALADITACLRLVVLDELHCVMTWGDKFFPATKQWLMEKANFGPLDRRSESRQP
jgi:superfamily II DNA helicase RecQ